MFSTYLEELEKIELLTPTEEQQLWEAYARLEDEDARSKLIEHYQPLVFREASRYKFLNNELMDCVQEGTIGLIEAVERFDYKKGVAFSVFAVHRIRGRMLDYLRREGKTANLVWTDEGDESNWWELIPATDEPIDVSIEHRMFCDLLINSLERLPQQERMVMEQVYLEDQTIRLVADEMDKSESYIHRLHRRGIRRLRGMLGRTRKEWDE